MRGHGEVVKDLLMHSVDKVIRDMQVKVLNGIQTCYMHAGGEHGTALGSNAWARGDCEVPAHAWCRQGDPQQAGQDPHRPVPTLLEQCLQIHAGSAGLKALSTSHAQQTQAAAQLYSPADLMYHCA